MPRLFERKPQTAGQIPGTPIYTGEVTGTPVRITVMDYDDPFFDEAEVEDPKDLLPFKDKPTVTWINVIGVHDVTVIEQIGRDYGIHPLVLEDIAQTSQRPKMEDYGDYFFFVLKMLQYDGSRQEITAEQVGLVLGPRYVISFQEREGDVFDSVRDRIRSAKGRIRKMGADYLLYAIIDAIVDHYYVILERLGDEIEAVEDTVMDAPTQATAQLIHGFKREVIFLRKSVWPLREAISSLEKSESSLITKGTRVFLRDVYDHTIQLIDTIETLRDVMAGVFDIYLSGVNTRMNEVMKVLTIIATIFIPITFIAGLYGMNFEYMPELKRPWAYPAVLAVMLGVVAVMLGYFKRRDWF